MLTVITFLTAILSGLGVGSAGLLVVFLTLVEGTPQLMAQGMNLIFFILSSGASLAVHVFRTPPLYQAVLLLIPTGVLGCLLGVSLATVLPHAALRRIFGGMLISSGVIGLAHGRKKREHIYYKAKK